jgi:molecular chaperone IbpA
MKAKNKEMSLSSLNKSLMYDPLFLGFDGYLKNISHTEHSYPPYNVVEVNENEYILEIAIAGFDKHDLEIILTNNVLQITGEQNEDSKIKYLHKGIATRKFTRTFNLTEDIEVKDADIHKGLLQIKLVKNMPEHKKPKKIEINS